MESQLYYISKNFFENNMFFYLHVNLFTNKYFKMLDFYCRSTKNFKNINTWKLFYFRLIESQLEFDTMI